MQQQQMGQKELSLTVLKNGNTDVSGVLRARGNVARL